MAQCHQVRNSGLLQSFIYLMNDFDVRNEILKYHIQRSAKKCKWAGTWVVRANGSDLVFQDPDPLLFPSALPTNLTVKSFLKKRKSFFQKASIFIFFTVCILYDQNLVHYVSFIYDPQQKSLISFDPGVELYHHGQKTIVPRIQDAFEKSGLLVSSRHQVLGACQEFGFKKKMGVQYNGNDKAQLPADAFCQSWTIFFFVRLLHSGEEDVRSFLSRWCSIHPKDREYFITSFFIMPTLMYFPKIASKYQQMVGRKDVVEQILLPVESCFFSHKSKSPRSS